MLTSTFLLYISVFSLVFSSITLTILIVLWARKHYLKRNRTLMIEKMSERLSLKKQFTEVQKILNGIIRMRNDDENLMEEDEL